MIVLIEVEGRKTTVTLNGKQIEYKTSFLKKMTVNDFLEYSKEKVKKL